jgi:basic amino acid/polyamine antiporter, APA family
MLDRMAELKRSLTTFDMTMIAIGGTIGSGIFLTPALIAGHLQTPGMMLAVWILGGAVTLSGALTYAEASALLPEAGGVYVFLSRAYGDLVGFLFGWAYLVVVNAGGLGALSVAFATYLGFFVPLGPVGTKVAAIAALAGLTALNVRGVKAGAIFSDVFTVLKLVGIAGLVLVGLALGSPGTTDFSAPLWQPGTSVWGPLALAMVGVLWSYGGWQHATFASAEVKDPRRSIPLAMTIAAIAVTVIYLLTNLGYLFLLTPGQMAASPRVAAAAVSTVLGPIGGSLISAAIIISTFGVIGIYTLTAPRIYYAMAADGLFFRKVAEIHPRYQTPAFAIIAQSAWAMVLVLFWGTFENLISYVVFTDWIFFALGGFSVIIFRRTMPDAPRAYRVPGYPWVPLFFVAVSTWFVAVTLVQRPAQAWAGLIFLGLGVPVYYYWKRQNRVAR